MKRSRAIMTATLIFFHALDMGSSFAHRTEKKHSHWDNSISIGGTINTGNSDTTNLSGKFTSDFARRQWVYQLTIKGEMNTANGERTAQNASGIGSMRYFINPRFYSFVKADATYDEFAAYDAVIKAAFGLGHVLLDDSKQFLSIEAGPGSSHQRISGTDEFQTLFMANVSALYSYRISPTAKLNQSLSSDIAKVNTHTEAVSAITTKVTDGLALEISFTIAHDSTIPINSKNTKKTDTTTKIAVVYDF